MAIFAWINYFSIFDHHSQLMTDQTDYQIPKLNKLYHDFKSFRTGHSTNCCPLSERLAGPWWKWCCFWWSCWRSSLGMHCSQLPLLHLLALGQMSLMKICSSTRVGIQLWSGWFVGGRIVPPLKILIHLVLTRSLDQPHIVRGCLGSQTSDFRELWIMQFRLLLSTNSDWELAYCLSSPIRFRHCNSWQGNSMRQHFQS